MVLKVKTSKAPPAPSGYIRKKTGALWIGPNHMDWLRPMIEMTLAEGETVTAFVVEAIRREIERRTT